MRFLAILVLVFTAYPVIAGAENPLSLAKPEGSISFDMEITQLNRKAIALYNREYFSEAFEGFKKSAQLAEQFRDPSRGAVFFNAALALHKMGDHEQAAMYFSIARKHARGSRIILESELLNQHICGFNPSVPCKKRPPSEMHIEGSH